MNDTCKYKIEVHIKGVFINKHKIVKYLRKYSIDDYDKLIYWLNKSNFSNIQTYKNKYFIFTFEKEDYLKVFNMVYFLMNNYKGFLSITRKTDGKTYIDFEKGKITYIL